MSDVITINAAPPNRNKFMTAEQVEEMERKVGMIKREIMKPDCERMDAKQFFEKLNGQ